MHFSASPRHNLWPTMQRHVGMSGTGHVIDDFIDSHPNEA
jgi:hypothetical protein